MKYSAIISNGKYSCGTAIIPGEACTAVRKAAAYGYNGVQLTIASPDDYDWPTLKSTLKETGLIVTALATGRIYSVEHLSMGSSNLANRTASVKHLCHLADVAADLDGAGLIIGACRGNTRDALDSKTYFSNFEISLKQLCAYAETLGVPILIELIEHLESDAYYKIEPLQKLLTSINAPNLFMYMDTMHLYNESEDILAVLKHWGAKIPQLDISGENRLPPMSSAINFADVVKALKESGFDGVLTFEVNPHDQPEVAKESLLFIKDLWETIKI